MVDVTMSMDEYLSLLGGLTNAPSEMTPSATAEMPKKKKSSAYSRRYKSNFRKVAPDYQKKDGSWKKNGFKSAVKLAHKMSKK